MIAKYAGICCYCSTKTEAGRDENEIATKRSWNVECAENQPPAATQYALAERLGYKHYTWEDLYARMPGSAERRAANQDREDPKGQTQRDQVDAGRNTDRGEDEADEGENHQDH